MYIYIQYILIIFILAKDADHRVQDVIGCPYMDRLTKIENILHRYILFYIMYNPYILILFFQKVPMCPLVHTFSMWPVLIFINVQYTEWVQIMDSSILRNLIAEENIQLVHVADKTNIIMCVREHEVFTEPFAYEHFHIFTQYHRATSKENWLMIVKLAMVQQPCTQQPIQNSFILSIQRNI